MWFRAVSNFAAFGLAGGDLAGFASPDTISAKQRCVGLSQGTLCGAETADFKRGDANEHDLATKHCTGS